LLISDSRIKFQKIPPKFATPDFQIP